MKMCSPPSVGSTFPKNDFCKYRVHDDVSMPKLASKPPLLGGHFRPVLCKKYYISPTERKIACLGSPIYHYFCSRKHFKANFHIFGVDFATFLRKLCWLSLLSQLAFWFQFPSYADVSACAACATEPALVCKCIGMCMHQVAKQAPWPIENWRAAVCPPQRAFNNKLIRNELQE